MRSDSETGQGLKKRKEKDGRPGPNRMSQITSGVTGVLSHRRKKKAIPTAIWRILSVLTGKKGWGRSIKVSQKKRVQGSTKSSKPPPHSCKMWRPPRSEKKPRTPLSWNLLAEKRKKTGSEEARAKK